MDIKSANFTWPKDASMVGTEKAPAFEKFLEIPVTVNQLGIKTVSEFTVEYTQSTHHQ